MCASFTCVHSHMMLVYMHKLYIAVCTLCINVCIVMHDSNVCINCMHIEFCDVYAYNKYSVFLTTSKHFASQIQSHVFCSLFMK